ncbi:MAG: hypothetical protein ACJ77Z_08195 [Thermoleophilaceae bacterium]
MAKLFGELGARDSSGARASATCLQRAGAAHAAGIGGARLGSTKADVLRRLGPPTQQTRYSMRYCVEGGGALLIAFDARGRLRVAASTSFSTHVHRVRTGSSLRRVKHVYPHAFWIGRLLLRAGHGSRVIFGSCSCGSVSFVGITDARTPAKIRYYAKRAGVPRAR